MNTDLLSLIDERVSKFLNKIRILKSKSAVVESIINDKVKVRFLDDNSVVTLFNRSGSFCIVGSNVLVYYWGNVITENTAYIGKTNTNIVFLKNTDELPIAISENTLYFVEDTGQILKVNSEDILVNYSGTSIEVDDYLSEISENPVQNKVITLKLKEFDGMFEEIKLLLEEIKDLLSGETTSLNGMIQADLIGLSEGISGIIQIENGE